MINVEAERHWMERSGPYQPPEVWYPHLRDALDEIERLCEEIQKGGAGETPPQSDTSEGSK